MFITNFVKILLLFSNIVRSSDISYNVYKQILGVHRVVRDTYKYDHQPEEAIPVAIVFDDDGGRDGKSIDNKVSKVNINSNKETLDTKKPTILRVGSDFNVKSADKEVDKDKIIVTTEKELQIPVAIVYEEEPKPARKQRKGVRRSKLQSQSQLNGRQSDKIDKTVSNSKTTPKIDTVNNKSEVTITEQVTEKQSSKKGVNSGNIQARKGNQERDPVIPIIQSENQVFGDRGDFRYSYEGGDGTQVFSTGELKSYGDNKKGEAVVGGFSYTDKTGQDISLSYTADENGYRPVGAHLPTPPPIPPAIERALRYLATKSTPKPVTESYTDDDLNEN